MFSPVTIAIYEIKTVIKHIIFSGVLSSNSMCFFFCSVVCCSALLDVRSLGFSSNIGCNLILL